MFGLYILKSLMCIVFQLVSKHITFSSQSIHVQVINKYGTNFWHYFSIFGTLCAPHTVIQLFFLLNDHSMMASWEEVTCHENHQNWWWDILPIGVLNSRSGSETELSDNSNSSRSSESNNSSSDSDENKSEKEESTSENTSENSSEDEEIDDNNSERSEEDNSSTGSVTGMKKLGSCVF